jgi:hypothetical protein
MFLADTVALLSFAGSISCTSQGRLIATLRMVFEIFFISVVIGICGAEALHTGCKGPPAT